MYGERPPSGPWQERVRWAGSTAFHPSGLLLRDEVLDLAVPVLEEQELGPRGEPQPILGGSYVRLTVRDPLAAVESLARRGVVAQVDHVLFATCGCPPHPAGCAGPPERGDVPDPEEVKANPFHANPFHANPFHANPFHANPFHANAGSGCCCGGGIAGNPFHANPFHANPFHANPFHANPFHANADPSPMGQESGRRRSSARPAEGSSEVARASGEGVRVAVLDTGWSVVAHEPTGLSVNTSGDAVDVPSDDGDQYLDPAAGHGTFIAGILAQDAPECEVEHVAVLGTYGDSPESRVAQALWELAQRPEDERPHIVSLSFGGYTSLAMWALADAVAELRRVGVVVVASAGNDGTCAPLYPAALPGVIGVAATDDDGRPAPFSNYGPWVRACAPGVDVVSLFFRAFDGDEPEVDGVDVDRFDGWARWSGTSFAAPRVAAAIARALAAGADAEGAVREVVDDGAEWRHLMGTFVPRP